jgi:hypothetical protein
MSFQDPCLRFTLEELRELARGKIPGFSKMKKRALCQALEKSGLLPEKISPLSESSFVGKEPPEWDFDRLKPIPPQLLPYDYIYSAGSSAGEIQRYFVLPDNFSVMGLQLPSLDGTRPKREFEIGAGDAFLEGMSFVLDNDEKVTLDRAYIPGAKGELIAPPIGSEMWRNLVEELQIVNMEGGPNSNAQLRRAYRIITTLQI